MATTPIPSAPSSFDVDSHLKTVQEAKNARLAGGEAAVEKFENAQRIFANAMYYDHKICLGFGVVSIEDMIDAANQNFDLGLYANAAKLFKRAIFRYKDIRFSDPLKSKLLQAPPLEIVEKYNFAKGKIDRSKMIERRLQELQDFSDRTFEL